jgi:hypothetical protein
VLASVADNIVWKDTRIMGREIAKLITWKRVSKASSHGPHMVAGVGVK